MNLFSHLLLLCLGFILVHKNKSWSPEYSWIEYGSESIPEDEGSNLFQPKNSDDSFGFSSTISGDGSTIAITSKSDTDIGYNGYVRILRYDDNDATWYQLGNDLEGYSTSDSFGQSVCLSYDGNIVAVGMFTYGSNEEGAVEVYEFKSSSNNWNQLGQRLLGNISSVSNKFGRMTSLSSDGLTMAVGAYMEDVAGYNNNGQTKIFSYSEGSNTWEQKGSAINGDADNMKIGYEIDLSSDGSHVIIGSKFYDNYRGLARVYRYDEGSSDWIKLGGDILGDSENSTNSNIRVKILETRVAVTFPKANGGRGLVKLYNCNDDLVLDSVTSFSSEQSGASWGRSMSLADNLIALSSDIGDSRVYDLSSGLWTMLGNEIVTGNGEFGKNINISHDGYKLISSGTGNSALVYVLISSTNAPSYIPSFKPSKLPSLSPSNIPSTFPSSQPSLPILPSNDPTMNFSEKPSMSPSEAPSTLTSYLPSNMPSFLPSSQPSQIPTNYHSSHPSIVPSLMLTVGPSMTPSLKLSLSPSEVSSTLPSSLPPIIPNFLPSFHPSPISSTYPSFRPSMISSLIPTASPSITPSTKPSLSPSKVSSTLPSFQPSSTELFSLTPSLTKFVVSPEPSVQLIATHSTSPSKSSLVFALTNSPSKVSTMLPSMASSTIMTHYNSDNPTFVHTSAPSFIPTVKLSSKFELTLISSSAPSNNLSFNSTSSVSMIPSYIEVHEPSQLPYVLPSNKPSSISNVSNNISSEFPTLSFELIENTTLTLAFSGISSSDLLLLQPRSLEDVTLRFLNSNLSNNDVVVTEIDILLSINNDRELGTESSRELLSVKSVSVVMKFTAGIRPSVDLTNAILECFDQNVSTYLVLLQDILPDISQVFVSLESLISTPSITPSLSHNPTSTPSSQPSTRPTVVSATLLAGTTAAASAGAASASAAAAAAGGGGSGGGGVSSESRTSESLELGEDKCENITDSNRDTEDLMRQRMNKLSHEAIFDKYNDRHKERKERVAQVKLKQKRKVFHLYVNSVIAVQKMSVKSSLSLDEK